MTRSRSSRRKASKPWSVSGTPRTPLPYRARRTRETEAHGLLALRPPPRFTVHEWAEAERHISSEETAEPGRWKSRPYQVRPLEAISDPSVEGVVYVAASQGGGKTELLLNAIGFHVDAEPAPMLLVEPTLEMADAISKDRIATMIRETPALRGKVADARSRDSGNTIRHKRFPGGHLTIVGANSASGLAMRPIRVLLFDEVDAYPVSAGSEGSSIKIAEKRTSSFWNAVRVYVSSPRDRVGSELLPLWEKSDQHRFFVDCEDCGREQFFKWHQVHWEKGEAGEHRPETAVYVCEHCGSCWDDVTRWRAIHRAGEDGFKPTKPFRGWSGFHLPAMAVLGRPLAPMVEEWLEAQGNPHALKVFVNTILAEWWEDEDEKLDGHAIEVRARQLGWSASDDPVPEGVAVLTLGCDVQKDRLEYEVIGWGHGEESWSLKYGRIDGDPRRDPGVLQDLDRVLVTPWEHPRGGPIYIRGAGIDTGFATQAMYRFCKPRLRRPLPDGRSQFVFALKGSGEPGKPIWPEWPSKRKSGSKLPSVRLWVVGSNAAKDQIAARLAMAEPGPGFCHFPVERPGWYYRQLTSEHAAPRTRGGQRYRVWEHKSADPNEAFDCRAYGYIALVALQSEPFGLSLEAEAARIHASQPREKAGPVRSAPARPARRRRRVRSQGVVV